MSPISDETTPDDTKELLKLLESGSTITPSELWKISMTASLTDVAASLRASAKMPLTGVGLTEGVYVDVSLDLTPQALATNIHQAFSESSPTTLQTTASDSHQNERNVILDLSAGIKHIDPSLAIKTAKQVVPAARVIVRGLTWIDDGAAAANLKPTEYLATLRAHGLDMIEEATLDRDLPKDHKWLIMACATAAEVAVVPLLTLRSLANSPDWSSWADDLAELRSRLVSNPLIFAVALRVVEDGLIMPSEYMMAVALASLYLPKPVGVWTPVCGMPALSPQKGLGAAANQHPVTKLVSALPMFGTTSLGMIPANRFNSRHVWEDLRASGIAPRLTNPRQHDQPRTPWMAGREESLRHVPRIGC
jgi:hypothetical protein